jgi:hypothetical protein
MPFARRFLIDSGGFSGISIIVMDRRSAKFGFFFSWYFNPHRSHAF